MPMQNKTHLDRRTGAQWRAHKQAEKARRLAEKNEHGAPLRDEQPVERATARPGEKRSTKRPAAIKVRQHTPTPIERVSAGFTGASIIGSLGSFQQLWISKQMYDEQGAAALCRHYA